MNNDEFEHLSTKDKLEWIRSENYRIMSYLRETIDWFENKYYDYFDVNELIVYCKSCEESYENIEYMTYELDNELHELTYQNE